jgi:hypothetical protein
MTASFDHPEQTAQTIFVFEQKPGKFVSFSIKKEIL